MASRVERMAGVATAAELDRGSMEESMLRNGSKEELEQA